MANGFFFPIFSADLGVKSAELYEINVNMCLEVLHPYWLMEV